MLHLSFRRKIILGLSMLSVSLLVAATIPGKAAAGITGCRSDPVVVLANLHGLQVAALDLSAAINDGQTDIQRVAYVVHAPAGMRVVAIVNTDGLIGLKETVRVYNDAPAKTYDVVTTVYTNQPRVSVTASSTVLSPLSLILGVGNVSGVSGAPLHAHFATLL